MHSQSLCNLAARGEAVNDNHGVCCIYLNMHGRSMHGMHIAHATSLQEQMFLQCRQMTASKGTPHKVPAHCSLLVRRSRTALPCAALAGVICRATLEGRRDPRKVNGRERLNKAALPARLKHNKAPQQHLILTPNTRHHGRRTTRQRRRRQHAHLARPQQRAQEQLGEAPAAPPGSAGPQEQAHFARYDYCTVCSSLLH